MACDEVKDLEAGSFEMLFRELYEPLCRYGRGIVEDDTVCEDIVEDAFVYLWDNRETLVVNTSVKNYLYATVRHSALRYLKRQLVQETHAPRLSEFITYLQETEYSEEETLQLEEAEGILSSLPEQCRKVFWMNCVENKRYKEVAEELGISVNTVKTHLAKAYRLFRERIGKRGRILLVILLFGKNKKNRF